MLFRNGIGESGGKVALPIGSPLLHRFLHLFVYCFPIGGCEGELHEHILMLEPLGIGVAFLATPLAVVAAIA